MTSVIGSEFDIGDDGEQMTPAGNASRLIVTQEGTLDPSLLIRTEGFMYKKGGAVNARGGFRNWKKRWFVLAPVDFFGYQGYELRYYDAPNGTLKGTVSLNDVDVYVESKSNHKRVKFEFQLVLQTGGELQLSCDDENERDEWIRTIEVIINFLHKVSTQPALLLDGYDPMMEDDLETYRIGDDLAQNCQAFGPGLFGSEAGKSTQFVVNIYDLSGQRVSKGGMPVVAAISNEDSVFYVALIDNEDGTYYANYTLGKCGKYSLAIKINDEHHIFGSPFDIEIFPSKTIPKFCFAEGDVLKRFLYKSTGTFTIYAMDGYGNRKHRGGDPFEVSIMGSAQLLDLQDNGDGTYYCTVASVQTAGTAYQPQGVMIMVTLYGKSIQGSPFKPLIVDGMTSRDTSIQSQQPLLQSIIQQQQQQQLSNTTKQQETAASHSPLVKQQSAHSLNNSNNNNNNNNNTRSPSPGPTNAFFSSSSSPSSSMNKQLSNNNINPNSNGINSPMNQSGQGMINLQSLANSIPQQSQQSNQQQQSLSQSLPSSQQQQQQQQQGPMSRLERSRQRALLAKSIADQNQSSSSSNGAPTNAAVSVPAGTINNRTPLQFNASQPQQTNSPMKASDIASTTVPFSSTSNNNGNNLSTSSSAASVGSGNGGSRLTQLAQRNKMTLDAKRQQEATNTAAPANNPSSTSAANGNNNGVSSPNKAVAELIENLKQGLGMNRPPYTTDPTIIQNPYASTAWEQAHASLAENQGNNIVIQRFCAVADILYQVFALFATEKISNTQVYMGLLPNTRTSVIGSTSNVGLLKLAEAYEIIPQFLTKNEVMSVYTWILSVQQQVIYQYNNSLSSSYSM
jgi:hypothetical protein